MAGGTLTYDLGRLDHVSREQARALDIPHLESLHDAERRVHDHVDDGEGARDQYGMVSPQGCCLIGARWWRCRWWWWWRRGNDSRERRCWRRSHRSDSSSIGWSRRWRWWWRRPWSVLLGHFDGWWWCCVVTRGSNGQGVLVRE